MTPTADEPRITLRVSQALHDRLSAEAKAQNLSVSALVRTKLVGADGDVVEDFERRLSRLEEIAGL